jgi:SAM-dependent methyltransferase
VLPFWMSAVRRAHREIVSGRRVGRLGRAVAELIPTECRSLLDVGTGSGDVARRVQAARPGLRVEGVDVLVRPRVAVPTRWFDGRTLPFADGAFDAVTLIDVLHHTDAPGRLLAESRRVARSCVIVKDHWQKGPFDRGLLRLMDWVGNAPHGVPLRYDYFSPAGWDALCREAGLTVERTTQGLGLYPFPFSRLLERHLQFASRLR